MGKLQFATKGKRSSIGETMGKRKARAPCVGCTPSKSKANLVRERREKKCAFYGRGRAVIEACMRAW